MQRIHLTMIPTERISEKGQVLKGQVLKGQVLKGQVLKGQVLKGTVSGENVYKLRPEGGIKPGLIKFFTF